MGYREAISSWFHTVYQCHYHFLFIKISKAGLGRRGGEAPSRIDPRDLQNVRRGDSQRAHTPRPRALALERATDAVPKPSHERDQGKSSMDFFGTFVR